jgi:hypothetical protein
MLDSGVFGEIPEKRLSEHVGGTEASVFAGVDNQEVIGSEAVGRENGWILISGLVEVEVDARIHTAHVPKAECLELFLVRSV